MLLDGALYVALGALGSLVLWVLVGRKMITKYGADAWIARLSDPDPAMERAIDALVARIFNEKMMIAAWNWFLTAEIPSGKTETLEDGSSQPIMTTPYRSLIDATGKAIYSKFASARGGLTTQGNAELAAEAPFLAQLGPRKGQSTGEWVVEQALGKALAPGGFLDQKLKSLGANITQQNGAGEWK